jgi:hypothetical protein
MLLEPCSVDGKEVGRRGLLREARMWCNAAMRTSWSIGDILLVIAIICFVLAAIGLKVDVSLVDIGLAFFAGSFLVAGRGPKVR